ncbi:MAG TPA: hypothetical protein DEA96_10765 [Leptospiraceae bacterium]|nr:hypothetical protein [Leptospiraceae bacterium]|tara:strand:+ start:503 stop:997 length:495 start_codon:yes stop_codon:yes gene_type:complete
MNRFLPLLLIAGFFYCSSGQPTGPDSMPPVAEASEPTRDWLYGTWTMDKERTVRRMLELNGQNFDSYTPDERQAIMTQFNLDLEVSLGPERWSAIFREGTRTNKGNGTLTYDETGSMIVVSMKEVLEDGKVKVDKLEIHKLGPDVLRMRFMEEVEDVSFILTRQ